MERKTEDTLNEAIDRLLAGTPMQDVLAAYPDDAGWIAPALRDAQMLQGSAPPSTLDLTVRDEARERMFSTLEETRMKANEFKTPPVAVNGQGRAGWFAGFTRRPASFRAAAVAGSIALVGVLGVGAAAATGNAPEPVREFFGSSSSALRVEFDGVINAIDANARTLDVDVAGDVRTVHVVDSTELSRGGDTIAFDLFAVGDPVEVKGALQPDDTIVASRVHLEDEFDDEPDADQTIDENDDGDDDDDGVDEDNSGPGNAEDEDDDTDDADDSSGPGSDDDDGEDHEDVNDDDLDDDSSGSGSIDDDADDDDSGPGSIDDESDDSTDTDDQAEDDSGSDSESHDGSDDSSGSGSDDEPDDD